MGYVVKVRQQQSTGPHQTLTFFVAPAEDSAGNPIDATFANVGTLTCTGSEAVAILDLLAAGSEHVAEMDDVAVGNDEQPLGHRVVIEAR